MKSTYRKSGSSTKRFKRSLHSMELSAITATAARKWEPLKQSDKKLQQSQQFTLTLNILRLDILITTHTLIRIQIHILIKVTQFFRSRRRQRNRRLAGPVTTALCAHWRHQRRQWSRWSTRHCPSQDWCRRHAQSHSVCESGTAAPRHAPTPWRWNWCSARQRARHSAARVDAPTSDSQPTIRATFWVRAIDLPASSRRHLPTGTEWREYAPSRSIGGARRPWWPNSDDMVAAKVHYRWANDCAASWIDPNNRDDSPWFAPYCPHDSIDGSSRERGYVSATKAQHKLHK